jgi:hypothetical protein
VKRILGAAVLLIALSTAHVPGVRAGSPAPVVQAPVVKAPAATGFYPPAPPLPAVTFDPSQGPDPGPADTTVNTDIFHPPSVYPTAQCADGYFSYSAHASGTCSHHGGVMTWRNPPGTASEYGYTGGASAAPSFIPQGGPALVGTVPLPSVPDTSGLGSLPSLPDTGCGSRGGPGYPLPNGKCA